MRKPRILSVCGIVMVRLVSTHGRTESPLTLLITTQGSSNHRAWYCTYEVFVHCCIEKPLDHSLHPGGCFQQSPKVSVAHVRHVCQFQVHTSISPKIEAKIANTIYEIAPVAPGFLPFGGCAGTSMFPGRRLEGRSVISQAQGQGLL